MADLPSGTERRLGRLVLFLEWASAVLLGIIGLYAIAAFFVTLVRASPGLVVGRTEFSILVDDLFVLFIVIELFKMAFVYMRGGEVLPVAFEAVIIAVARKVVLLDFSEKGALEKALALSLVVVASAIGSRVMEHRNPQ